MDNAADAHINPTDFRAYLARRRGVPIEEVRAPALIVATFQPEVRDRLWAITAAEHDPATPQRGDVIRRGTVGGREVGAAFFPVGAPAAAMILEELIACGARRLLFVGSAGSLQPRLPIGALALATSAIREEGTSFHYLPPDAVPRPSPILLEALRRSARAHGQSPEEGPVWTIDAVYRELSAKVTAYAAQGVLAVEMEAAALFAVAEYRGVEAALIVAMSDELFHPWRPGFHAAEYRAGMEMALDIALGALAEL